MAVRTLEELRLIFIAAVQAVRPDLTDTNDGSNLDVTGRGMALGVSELSRLTLDEFRKTFLDSANGPEVTGGPDELQTLAVDHFGDTFARPLATKATGTVTFSRPTSGAGNVSILTGTIVKTAKDADGVEIRFATTADVTLTGLTINAPIEAVIASADGNVLANKIVVIESTLTDSSVVVTNAAVTAGGSDTETDEEYRETIRDLFTALKGAIKAAIEAAARTADGVVYATAIEIEVPVIDYDIATDDIMSGAFFFRIPKGFVYVADEDGNSSPTLIAAAQAKIDMFRAMGVYIQALGGTASTVNWTIDITLNPGGPNFSILSLSTELIRDSMAQYINELAIGSGFNIATAQNAILAIWGPSGTNDITGAISTSIPAADIAGTVGVKLIAGTMAAS